MSEWRETTLGNFCSRVITGGTPDTKISAYYQGGTIPWVKTKEVNYKSIVDTESYITQEGLDNSSAKMIPTNSIIVAMYGQGDTAGRVAINKIPVCTNQACCNLVIDESKADYRFIYYVLCGAYNELVALKSGSAQPNLNTSRIKGLTINAPDADEQCAIAEVLSSIDDKIDLLTRQNATLEAMAQTYFRQWFVEETDEDWEEVLFSHFVNVKYGKDHKHLSDGSIPVYGSGGIMRYADTALYDKESVLIPRKGSLGNVIYINTPFWSVDTMFYTEMKQSNIAKFIYYFICDLDLISMNVGSAVPSMTTDVLNNLPIVKPPRELLEKFDIKIATPLFSKIEANTKQILILQKLRNTLLPKLISGEVRVKSKVT